MVLSELRETGTIWYPSNEARDRQEIAVQFLPDTKQKIAMDKYGQCYLKISKRDLWQKFNGIFDLFRGLSHTLAQYDFAELPVLERILAQERDLHLELIGLTEESLNGSLGVNIQTRMIEMWKPLAQVIDDFKQSGRDQIVICLRRGLKDSRGRLNVGVLMCRATTARERFKKRIENIQSIQARVLFLHTRVRQIIGNSDKSNEAIRNQLRHALLCIRQTERIIKQGNEAYLFVKTAIETACRLLSEQMSIHPYTRTQRHLREELERARALLDRASPMTEEMQKELDALVVTMGSSLRLKAVQWPLEAARVIVSLGEAHPDHFTIPVAQRVKNSVGKIAFTELPEIREEGFEQPVIADMLHALARAHNKLHPWQPTTKKHLREIKELLSEALSML